MVQDAGKYSYIPLIASSGIEVFSIVGGTWGRVGLLNRDSRVIPATHELNTNFLRLCEQITPKRILLFTDFETRKSFGKIDMKYLTRSGDAIVESEERKELWLLASGSTEIKKFCTNKTISPFFDNVNTNVVGYGR